VSTKLGKKLASLKKFGNYTPKKNVPNTSPKKKSAIVWTQKKNNSPEEKGRERIWRGVGGRKGGGRDRRRNALQRGGAGSA
jgi:hypothetical protein